jgi:hypothetical protein
MLPLLRLLEVDMYGGLKDGADMKHAVNCAHGARTAPAGTYHGGNPPPGPKAEPVKVNGVPMIKERGTSK